MVDAGKVERRGYMMFCPKCGANLGEFPVETCPYCGNSVQGTPVIQQRGNGAQPQEQGGETTILTGQGYQQNGYQQNGYQQNGYQQRNPSNGNGQLPYQYQNNSGKAENPAKTMPMGWYNFIIYAQLFIIALLCLSNAVMNLTGASLGSKEEVELLYGFFPELKGMMMVTAVLMLAISILSIVVRQWLAHYQHKGVIGLYILRGLIILNNLIYGIGLTSIVNIEIPSTTVSACLVSVVLLIIDFVYFGKRRHLFQ